jgi:hypothetical protein
MNQPQRKSWFRLASIDAPSFEDPASAQNLFVSYSFAPTVECQVLGYQQMDLFQTWNDQSFHPETHLFMKTPASLLVFIPIVSTVLSVWKSLSPKFSQILWTPNPNWTPRALEDLPGTWGHGKGSGEWPGPCLQSQDSSLPISGWISGLGITWPFFSFMAPWHHDTPIFPRC